MHGAIRRRSALRTQRPRDPHALRRLRRDPRHADAVHVDWGTPNDKRIAVIGAEALDTMEFPAGSMGPKVEAATAFVRSSGHEAYIGRLQDVSAMLEGSRGTRVVPGDAPAQLV